jgi:hypothetical protein
MKRWGLFAVPFLTLLLGGAAYLHAGRARPRPDPRPTASISPGEMQYRQVPVRHWRSCLIQH